MVEFFGNQITMGTFGSVDDSQFVQAFRQIEDAGQFYAFLDKIARTMETQYARFLLILRLKESLGIDMGAGRLLGEILSMTMRYFNSKVQG